MRICEHWTLGIRGPELSNAGAALAAMHAVSARNALLTVLEGTATGASSITYTYGAPTLPVTPDPSYYTEDAYSVITRFTTDAAALQADANYWANFYGCPGGGLVGDNGGVPPTPNPPIPWANPTGFLQQKKIWSYVRPLGVG